MYVNRVSGELLNGKVGSKKYLWDMIRGPYMEQELKLAFTECRASALMRFSDLDISYASQNEHDSESSGERLRIPLSLSYVVSNRASHCFSTYSGSLGGFFHCPLKNHLNSYCVYQLPGNQLADTIAAAVPVAAPEALHQSTIAFYCAPGATKDEKSNKMTKEELTALIQEYSLLEGWYARVPGLQEPANYGTKFETGIYEEQVKSGYRLPLHPFALEFFKHYCMAPEQLALNGWRNLIGLIYLVETSGYKADPTNFIRVFFEICFVKKVANCHGWYYIHSRQRLLKGGPKSNKGWHSRYFFVGREDKGELLFDKNWNPYCKDYENTGKPTPNNFTKHILSHIKLRGGLSIDEPLSEQHLEYGKIIPRKSIPAGLSILPPLHIAPSTPSTETAPLALLHKWLVKAGNHPNEALWVCCQKLRVKRKRNSQVRSCPCSEEDEGQLSRALPTHH
ncbi:hypothetical protein RJ640_003454 [Escallonia rubra]|uniref:Transposase (putative) gypsy type domain-containing protein n=1 Tax=Escallonia rubra TaxID=112253 RepID=A0AA88QTZ2_9ASTE|nr:hypothetical protein RJ640_003454 [Escallonia rubra]